MNALPIPPFLDRATMNEAAQAAGAGVLIDPVPEPGVFWTRRPFQNGDLMALSKNG
jgi:hypothetical protein